MTVSLDDTPQIAINWINAHSYVFTEWGYKNASIWGQYQVYSSNPGYIPFSVIIDLDRNVRYEKVGGISNPSDYIVIVDELL